MHHTKHNEKDREWGILSLDQFFFFFFLEAYDKGLVVNYDTDTILYYMLFAVLCKVAVCCTFRRFGFNWFKPSKPPKL